MLERESSRSASDSEDVNGSELLSRSGSKNVHNKLLSLKAAGILLPGDQVTAKYKRDVFIAELDTDGFLVVLGAREASSGADNSAEYQDLIGVRFGSPSTFLNAMVNLYLSRCRGRRGREKMDSWGLCLVQRHQKSLAQLCRQLEQKAVAFPGNSTEESAAQDGRSSEKRPAPSSGTLIRSRRGKSSGESSSSASASEGFHDAETRGKDASQASRADDESDSSDSDNKGDEKQVEPRRERRLPRKESSRMNTSTRSASVSRSIEKKPTAEKSGKVYKKGQQASASSKAIGEPTRRRSAPTQSNQKNLEEAQESDFSLSSPSTEAETQVLLSDRGNNARETSLKVEASQLAISLWNLSDWVAIARRMLDMLTLKPKVLLSDQEPVSCENMQAFVDYVKSAALNLAPHSHVDDACLASFAAGVLQGAAEVRQAVASRSSKDAILSSSDALRELNMTGNLKEHGTLEQVPSGKSPDAEAAEDSSELGRLESRASESERGSKRRKSELDELRSKLESEMGARQELELERRNLLVHFADAQKLIVREAKRRRTLEEDLATERMTVNELNDRIDRVKLRLTQLLGVGNFVDSDHIPEQHRSQESSQQIEDANTEDSVQHVPIREKPENETAEVIPTAATGASQEPNRSMDQVGRGWIITENQALRARLARMEKELREWQNMLVAERCVRSLLTDAKARLESDIGDLRVISERVHERRRIHKEPAQKKSKKKPGQKEQDHSTAPSQLQTYTFSSAPPTQFVYGNENAMYDRVDGFLLPPVQGGFPGMNPYPTFYHNQAFTPQNGLISEPPLLISNNTGWPPHEEMPPPFGMGQHMVYLDRTQFGVQGGNMQFTMGMDPNIRMGYVAGQDRGLEDNFRMAAPSSMQLYPPEAYQHDPTLYGYGNTPAMR
ncbi:hypothetical protein F1559_003600 [Cyanidiococcus yangmingshanensis]|uniref:Uncharacterized protein n=1 Tax=Cyanidiococcus yangmingshanensis TaxID=2690220 RepID=A0A7J7IN21_9RHOD|nr:hypothetical protein F1559_003600 [Cyanidiococcus yangmingshanensis]